MKKLFLFATVVALMTTSGCKKDSTTNSVSCGNGTFNCTIDSVAFTSISTKESNMLKGTYLSTPFKRLEIAGKAADGKNIFLIISNFENAESGDGVMVRDYFCDPSLNYTDSLGYTEGAEVKYMQGVSTVLGSSLSFGSTGKISIISCDAKGHTVAGNFQVEMDDQTGTGRTYTIVGTFANVCYTVK